jgi:hypothetical protein
MAIERWALYSAESAINNITSQCGSWNSTCDFITINGFLVQSPGTLLLYMNYKICDLQIDSSLVEG